MHKKQTIGKLMMRLFLLLFIPFFSKLLQFSLAFPLPFSPVKRPNPRKTQRLAFASPEVGVNVATAVQRSVALVIPISVRNTTTRGSGFCVDWYEEDDDESHDLNYKYFVTAAHVAAPGCRLNVSVVVDHGDCVVVPGTIIGRNMALDLALVRIDITDDFSIQPLKIADELPPVGTLAFAHGYPATRLQGPAMTCGIVCGIANGLGLPDDSSVNSQISNDVVNNRLTNETTFVVTDAAMAGGMSGGPLVDASGTVLGVNALIRPDLRALGNYAVSANELKLFLETEKVRVKSAAVDDCSQSFHVVLFNDHRNKRARIIAILKNVAHLGEEDSMKVMMEAHTNGRGVIREFPSRDEATDLCQALQTEDILVEVEVVNQDKK